MTMIDRYCVMCGKRFMAYGNTRTCSSRCSYEQMKMTKEKCAKRRKERKRKKHKSTLLETQQKAREAGMSYGIYYAVTKGGMAIERGEADGKNG